MTVDLLRKVAEGEGGKGSATMVRSTQVTKMKGHLVEKVLRGRARIVVGRGPRRKVRKRQKHRGKPGGRQKGWLQALRSSLRSKPQRSSQRHS